jgi:hypothetical protein
MDISLELTEELLKQEFSKWSLENGAGRNKDDQRFGQYLWNKYELGGLFASSDAAVDGFGDEKPSDAYAKLMGAILNID